MPQQPGASLDSASTDNAPDQIQQGIADGTYQTFSRPSTLPSLAYNLANTNADKAAEAQRLSAQTGIGPDIVGRNMDDVKRRAAAQDMADRQLDVTSPILARQLGDMNFATVAHDDLDNLSGIEQSAAQMKAHATLTISAYTPSWLERGEDAVTESLFNETPRQAVQRLYDYPLTRMGIDAAGGVAGFAGNVGSFFGWHGNAPSKQNLLQRIETGLSPEANVDPERLYSKSGDLDALVKNVAPMLPAMLASGGVSGLANALKIGPRAASVLAGLTVGGAFTADQAGQTYTGIAGSGGSDELARREANRTAAITAPFNALFGAQELVPFMRENPLLTSLGVGGLTGASGRAASNLAAGKPWSQGIGSSAIQAAAMQGGMHIGTEGFIGSLGDAIDATEASKLRQRAPETFAQSVEQTFDGHASLQIPVEKFDSYFSDKGMNPQQVAAGLGSTNYAEAALSGGNVEIAPASFLSDLAAEHQRALLPDVIDPSTGMSRNQAQEAHQELENWVAEGGPGKLVEEARQADAETQATHGWQAVKDELKQRYAGADMSEQEAETTSTLHANVYANLARESGMTPEELLAQTNPKVVKGEAPAAESTVHQQPWYQSAIDGIRSVVRAAGEPGDVKKWTKYAPVSEWLRDAAKTAGLTLDGFEHGIDADAVRHVRNEHGDAATETSRGQRAITDEDFEKLPLVVAEPDRVVFGAKSRDGLDQIFYVKKLDDGSIVHVEESRTGRKRLAAVSMRKYPAAANIDNIVANLDHNVRNDGGHTLSAAKDFGAITDTLPSNARSDGGTEPIVVRGPGADKGEAATESGETLYQGVGGEGSGDHAETKGTSREAQRILPGGVRGWMRKLPDGSFEVGRTKIADFSTLVHETAHLYLETVRDLVKRPEASDQLKGDYQKILDFLGAKDGEDLTPEQHEKWARANEQYAREGKAPSAGLRGVFQRFAVWLGQVYHRATDLGVELDPETRGVMDRMYAAESGVDKVAQEGGQPLFRSAEEAGWTDDEYRNYAEAKGVSVDQAKAQVRRELNDAAEREQTEGRREERRNVYDAMMEHVDNRPEYKAIRALRSGKLEDVAGETGEPISLNRDELAERFGEDRVKALQKAHPGLYRLEGGTDPEAVAEIFGFRSADEMLSELTAAPRRKAAIEAATRDYLVNKYGDVRYDGTLNDRARYAIENKERAGNIYRELRALKSKVATLEKRADDAKAAMRSITIAPLEQYQEAARQMIQQKAPADLQPHRYLDASRRYSREAFDALRNGHVERAADAKHKELLNHFLYREATAEREYLEKFERHAKQTATSRGIQQRLALAGEDYRDQVNWLLARYRLGPGAVPPERSLRAWADAMYDVGKMPVERPAILDGSRIQDYRGVPMSEIHDLHDVLLNVQALARQKFKMFVQGKQIAFAEARTAMIESARENLRVKPEKTFEENRSAADRALDSARYVDARLTMMERMVEWLDGGKTGPWHDNLWNLAADAQGDEADLQQKVTSVVTDALADMPASLRWRLWLDKVNVDGVGEPMTRRRMLSIAFNMGNEGNLDRLRKTFIEKGWDPDAIRKIGGMLTHEEWQFVQKTWDSLKPLGQRMNELEKRLTGLAPVMVEPMPFKVVLQHGEEMDLAGGYFPIVMDPKHSQRAIEQDAKESAQNAMQSGYVRATTSKGYTKERTGYGGQLLLDYEQALTGHVAHVSKDLSHREFMLMAQRFLPDTEVRKTLRETLGPAYEAQFMPWLRTIINDNNGSVQEGLDGFKTAMQTLRGNFVVGSLAFNPSTLLLQLSHAPRMLLYAKPGSLAQSLVDLLAHPIERTQEIHDLSKNEMRFRGDNLDRDIRKVLQQPEFKGGYARKVAIAGRFALEMMDHLLSHTLWRAAYNDALGKYADLSPDEASKKAVYEADSAVRLGLGSHAPKDLPAIMRNNEFNRFITTLYGFHNGVYNQLRDNAHQFRYGGGAAKLTYATILSAVIPAVLGSWLIGQRPKDGENAGFWAAKKSLLFAADTVPILRACAAALDRGKDVQLSPIESLMTKGVKDFVEATSDKEDKDWLGIGLDAGELAGQIGGLPGAHEAAKVLKYMHRSSQGKIANPNLWDAIVGGGSAARK